MFEHFKRVRTFPKRMNVSDEHKRFPFILHRFGFKIWAIKLFAFVIHQKNHNFFRSNLFVLQPNIKMFDEWYCFRSFWYTKINSYRAIPYAQPTTFSKIWGRWSIFGWGTLRTRLVPVKNAHQDLAWRTNKDIVRRI